MKTFDYSNRLPTREALTLALSTLWRAGIRTTNAQGELVFYLLQRLLWTTHEGAKLRMESFKNHHLAKRVLECWQSAGLVTCETPFSHLPQLVDGEPDFTNCRPRAWLPSVELLLANLGEYGVASWNDYKRGVDTARDNGNRGGVRLRREWRDLGLNDTASGLFYNWNAYANDNPTPKKTLLLSQQVGRAQLEINPRWTQAKAGRLYASQPAACSLLRSCRRHLLSVDGKPVQSVDYSTCETRVAYALAGVNCPPDPYADIQDKLSLRMDTDRDTIKRHLSALLHGRRAGFEYGLPYWKRKTEREVFDAITDCLPHAVALKLNEWRATKGEELQHTVAAVFLPTFAACIRDFGLSFGIPLHDGWLFAATADVAEEVRTRFEEAGERHFGVSMPCKREQLNNTENTHAQRTSLAPCP